MVAVRRLFTMSWSRGAAFGFGEHENKSGSRHVGRETVAAKRNGSCPGRLCFIADLAGRWRRVWTKAARLFQESLEISAAPRAAKSAKRGDQSRRRSHDRQICRLGNQNESLCRSCPQTNRR